ncbi:MAG: ornithine carbamoyltransferase [Pirellulaceae bacterium]
MKHFLTLRELPRNQIETILETAIRLKRDVKRGNRESFFQNRVLGLLFEKPSLRTRVSFETLFAQHGGSSIYLSNDVGWPNREPICDFIPILTSYVDLLVIRSKSHAVVEEAVRYAQCPIINGLTDVSHPCQALADILTVMELTDDLGKTKITYVGDANNVAYSLAVICDKLGIELVIAAPEGYQFDDSFLNQMTSGCVSQTSDAIAAMTDANFVYTDVWTSMGQEEETAARLKAFANYQVNQGLMKHAADNCKLLHCLPARRGEEVSAEVIDGPQSAIIQQAENRLHAQKGLVHWMFEQNR